MAPLFFIALGLSALAVPVWVLSRITRLLTGVPDSNEDFSMDWS
jgi:hypothetical protein